MDREALAEPEQSAPRSTVILAAVVVAALIRMALSDHIGAAYKFAKMRGRLNGR